MGKAGIQPELAWKSLTEFGWIPFAMCVCFHNKYNKSNFKECARSDVVQT